MRNSPDSWRRKLPVGAELVGSRAGAAAVGAHFRLWAPRRERVDVVLEDGSPPRPLAREPGGAGYFSGLVEGVGAGARYRFRLDRESPLYPDPASRFQPDGPHGPSEVIDPTAFRWSDGEWRGPELRGQVIYELHVGTFTPEGTWESAARALPQLAELGVTAIELLPIAEFPGRFGWGYDGVDPFAPTRLYGTPDDLRRFVDRAHRAGLAVILDVVYNHLGPDGNYLFTFSPSYRTDRHENEWGDPLDFDGPDAGPVRELFVANAGYWIDEFHIDGLRLDATQSIHDASDDHIVAAIARRVRDAGGARRTLLFAENEPQDTRLIRPPEAGGHGLDALWNDDFHHSARVAATGSSEAYYTDYRGTPQELISAVKRGFLFQGQRSMWQRQPRGTWAGGIEPARFVQYLQNHDQVANSGYGERLHQLTTPGRCRALTALLLLAPGTPLLFQGQEYWASTPWCYFADHGAELGRLVREGRAEFMRQFASLATPEGQGGLCDPGDVSTFLRCKLDPAERARNTEPLALHRDLLRLRREDPAFAAQRPGGVDGAVLAAEAFVLRFFPDDQAERDRLLVVNLGASLTLAPLPEPLLAPVARRRWAALWSSEDPRYGGHGTPPVDTDAGLRMPAHAAVVLAPGTELGRPAERAR
jgi:maltooligosyltrehalose trehalohydrolase